MDATKIEKEKMTYDLIDEKNNIALFGFVDRDYWINTSYGGSWPIDAGDRILVSIRKNGEFQIIVDRDEQIIFALSNTNLKRHDCSILYWDKCRYYYEGDGKKKRRYRSDLDVSIEKRNKAIILSEIFE